MGEMGSVPIYVVDFIGPNARRLPFSLEGIYTGRIWGRKGGEMGLSPIRVNQGLEDVCCLWLLPGFRLHLNAISAVNIFDSQDA